MELDFIREFSTGGESLQGLSTNNRRERIRVAIYNHKLPHTRFREGPMTYSQAYAQCFGRPLEMRSIVKDPLKSDSTTAEIEGIAPSANSASRVRDAGENPNHRGPKRAATKSPVRTAKDCS